MVHMWITLRNDALAGKCNNSRVTRLFRNKKAYFYGDYDLDVFLGDKHDYKSLEAVVAKVLARSSGWIRTCKLENEKIGTYTTMHHIISEFGRLDDSQIHKFVPRKEKCAIVQSRIYRKDGNFSFIACETERYYYVFAFATS